MKKSNPTIKAQILRSAFYLLLLLGVCAIPFALAQRSFDSRTTSVTPSKQTQRTLTFADRVAYQRAIEEVYWQHRIWPKENASLGKPSLDAVMSRRNSKRKSRIICATHRSSRITGNGRLPRANCKPRWTAWQQNTKQPEVLRQ